ncbi:PIM3 kinase, partial [Polypterus senegalus]
MELLPLEAALLQIASSPPTSPRVICFLDRFQTSSEYLLVMERPEPCKDLYEFLLDQTQGKFGEPLAKYIFRQIVEAVIHCHSRGILHDDVKVNNILVQTTTYQVKLIDFGVGSILMEPEHCNFGGNVPHSGLHEQPLIRHRVKPAVPKDSPKRHSTKGVQSSYQVTGIVSMSGNHIARQEAPGR